jgi:primase-polymerase (primpol)-like protein
LQLGDMNGIGLVVGANDPYCIVDIDERQERETRTIRGPSGPRIVALLDTITEYSPNFGLHFLVKLEKPLPEAVKDEVELYFAGRYMTVTADLVPHSPLVIATRQAEIEALFMQYKGYSFDQARTASSPVEKITREKITRGSGGGK